jgi:hypothetical protein
MKKNMRSHTNDGLKGTLDLLVTRKRFVTPITAQFLKQLRWERHVPVASTLALADVDHHPLAVDILDFDL